MSQPAVAAPSREELLAECFPIAKAIARQIHARLPRGVDLDDLVGAAVMGLMDAADRWDPSRGVAFKAFAKHRMQGAVLDSLRATDWVPRAVRRRADSVARARTHLRTRLGCEPSTGEVGAFLGMDAPTIAQVLREGEPQPLLSLDVARDEDGAPLGDLVPGDEDPEADLQDRERRRLVATAIEALPERERIAIDLFYFREVPLKEVGRVLGVTESRACQLCSQGIKRMQQRLLAATA